MTVALSLFVMLLATPAAAAPAKHTKPMLDMQRVATPLRAAPTATQAPLRPQLTVDQFVWAKRDNLVLLGDRQIILLQRMITLAESDDPQLPDFFFRLAELYAEKYHYYEMKARRLDEAIFRAEQAEAAPPSSTAPQPQ
jgi:hypothetical protein